MFVFLDNLHRASTSAQSKSIDEISSLNDVIRKKDEDLLSLSNELRELRCQMNTNNSATTEPNMEYQKVLTENGKLIAQMNESKRENVLLSAQLLESQAKMHECDGNELVLCFTIMCIT